MPISEIIWTPDNDALGGGAGAGGSSALLAALASSGEGVTMISLTEVAPPTSQIWTLTAGFCSDANFDTYGFGVTSCGIIGSINPTTIEGLTFSALITTTSIPLPFTNGLRLGITGAISQSLFDSITINGQTFLSSAATSFGSGVWFWKDQFPFSAIGDYEVTFQPSTLGP